VRQPYVVPRRRLLFAVWLTVLALPILVIDNIPRTEARAAPVKIETDGVSTPSSSASTTTVPPTSEVTTTTDAPSTTAPERRATTVRQPAPTTVVTTTTAPSNEQEGGASWYDYRAGECAHRTLPKGTVVTITRLDTGARATCVVTDRGPWGAGRIIDLDRGTFAQLADPSTGVIQVRITW
jgi:peptidoglycan lytic transglycosylase